VAHKEGLLEKPDGASLIDQMQLTIFLQKQMQSIKITKILIRP